MQRSFLMSNIRTYQLIFSNRNGSGETPSVDISYMSLVRIYFYFCCMSAKLTNTYVQTGTLHFSGFCNYIGS